MGGGRLHYKLLIKSSKNDSIHFSSLLLAKKKPKQAERTWNTFAIIALFCAPIFISLLERTDSIYPDFFYPLAVC